MVVRYAVSVTARDGAVSDYLREETVVERKRRLVNGDRPEPLRRRREAGALRGWRLAPTRSTRRTGGPAGAASVCGSRARRTTPGGAGAC